MAQQPVPSYPEPPDIFAQGQNQNEIYNRILGAIEPKDAERSIATINKQSWKSQDHQSDSKRLSACEHCETIQIISVLIRTKHTSPGTRISLGILKRVHL